MQSKPPKELQTEKAKTVHAMFSEVAQNYDRLNSVISLGVHHRWRRECVRWSAVRAGDRVLDLATGTGDLALEFAKVTGEGGEVIGTDFNAEMIRTAPEKAQKLGRRARFELADATALTFPDSQFDVVSISFGIRNVDDPRKALAEMARVSKPSGRVMILETGQATNPVFKAGFDLYFGSVMPRLAKLLGGSQGAYGYLQKSSAEFPSGAKFLDLMRSAAKFSSLEAKPLFGGVAWLYRGVVEKG